MRRLLLGTAFVAVSLGCVATAPDVRPFTETDYAPYRNASQATSLSGQAFMKARGGEVRYAAGNVVVLDPATPHSEDVVRSLVAGLPGPKEEPRAKEFQKTTLADGEGRFRFSGLAPGDYFVRTYVVWEFDDRLGTHHPGGWIYNRVTVHENEAATVVVSTRKVD